MGFINLHAQEYWQQSIDYKMEIDMLESKGQYLGKQTITYQNNSSDIINHMYLHLYFNAFKPGSMMDVRSRSIADPDPRVRDRISKLKPEDQGDYKFNSIQQDGVALNYEVDGTILRIELDKELAPGNSTIITTDFLAQIPNQIRRSGKNNKEGIDFSMTQWYPKVCAYDNDGWHPNPYIAREFYGIWGDFDVKITIDSDYVIGASGVLQNPGDIGYGYASKPKKPKGKRATWHFKAQKVHDFAWAADTDYEHFSHQVKDGPMLHMIYSDKVKDQDNWEKVALTLDSVWNFIESNFGDYPYPQYTIIQGGDGGMEYPMITLITGNRPFGSLLGVSIHELMHSWYQGLLGTNEALYAYMDEGFTVYASNLITKEINDPDSDRNPMAGNYEGYRNFVLSGLEEALSTHADHFSTNSAYGVGSYTKGAILLHQLSYIIGEDALKRTMLSYYDQWKYKHPDIDKFIRVAERESNLVLDWYKEYWINSTKTIDYGIDSVYSENDKLIIDLKREGEMPMPVDLSITLTSGEEIHYNIPLRIMRGDKLKNERSRTFILEEDWPWTNPKYSLEIEGVKLSNVKKVSIDASERMADINLENNTLILGAD